MYHRLQALAQTGVVVYAIIRNAAGEVWDGTSFGTFVAASWSSYAVTLTEQGTSGWYQAAIPSGITTAGLYHVTYHRRMTSSPLITDPQVYETTFGVGRNFPAVDSSATVNLPSIPTGWITASGIASGALDSVWSAATRTLTSGAGITLAKGTGITGFNDLNAADVRAAVGLASANLDTQIAAIPTSILDLSSGIESGITPRGALRLILASAAGKLSGAATTTVTIRNVGDTKDRIVATVDADGNRTAVTTDAT